MPADGTKVTFYYDNNTHWVTTNLDGDIVTAAGDFQSEIGCRPTGRRTACALGWRTRTGTASTPSPPPRSRPATTRSKRPLNQSWDVNYGAGGVPGGANIEFTVPSDGAGDLQLCRGQAHIHRAVRQRSAEPEAGEGVLAAPQLHRLERRHQQRQPDSYRLYAAPNGGLTPAANGITGGTSYPLTLDPAGLPAR